MAITVDRQETGRFGGIVREVASWSTSLKVGVLIMVTIVLAAIFAPWIAPFDPYEQNYEAILLPPGFPHLFGTLTCDAMKWARPITRNADGSFKLPDLT